MSLGPSPSDLLARARSDLRMGVPVVVRHGAEMAVVAAIESLDAARLTALRGVDGEMSLTLTARRAETLRARAYDGDLARVVIEDDMTLAKLNAIADPKDDLSNPMKGPLRTRREGDAHLHRAAIALTKAARLMPAAIVVDGVRAAPDGLTVVDADTALSTDLSPLEAIVAAHVPLRAAPNTRLHVFRPEDGGEEHYIVEIGRPARDAPVLTRLHSACFTGDLLGSLKCDCGPQLNAALNQMGTEGAGILLYLNQEGRGIGLANKMRAYALQDQGFDTVEANHRLGFEDDERDFRIGAALLSRMGFSQVRLMTNNPAKVARMEASGITVTERVPLKVGHTAQNEAYLATKAAKSGHLL